MGKRDTGPVYHFLCSVESTTLLDIPGLSWAPTPTSSPDAQSTTRFELDFVAHRTLRSGAVAEQVHGSTVDYVKSRMKD